jgi:SNF2 family DNA or RNA helicase
LFDSCKKSHFGNSNKPFIASTKRCFARRVRISNLWSLFTEHFLIDIIEIKNVCIHKIEFSLWFEIKILRREETRSTKLIFFETPIEFYFLVLDRKGVQFGEKTIFTGFILN